MVTIPGAMLRTRRDQSIAFLGRSGSGKSTNAKHVLKYYASAFGTSSSSVARSKTVQSLPPIPPDSVTCLLFPTREREREGRKKKCGFRGFLREDELLSQKRVSTRKHSIE